VTRRTRRRRGEGFTLLEVLLTVAVVAVLVSVTSGIVTQISGARDTLDRRRRNVQAARAALWLVQKDLTTVAPGTLRIDREPGRSPIVSFAIDAPEPRRVEYRLDRGRLLRRVHEQLRLAADERPHVVAHHVRRFDVTALGDDGWHDTWATAHPPRALTVTLERRGTSSLALTVVPRIGGTG